VPDLHPLADARARARVRRLSLLQGHGPVGHVAGLLYGHGLHLSHHRARAWRGCGRLAIMHTMHIGSLNLASHP